MEMTDIYRKIDAFISHLNIRKLPESTVKEAKRSLLDTLGCMIGGLETPFIRKLANASKRFVDEDGATVLGIRQSVSPFFAAMCNAFMANALDADDGHRMSRLHAGGVIIPAVLAAAEENDCDGETLLKAMIVGYELGLRAGMASTAGDIYFGSAFGSTFGAAAAAGLILGLSNEQMINAMGICEMHAPNSMLMGWINSRKIPMIKEGMGWSAASSIIAAYLAMEGVTGTLTIFDGREEISKIDQLGKKFEIERRYYKPVPGCRWTQAPLQTVLSMIGEYRLGPDDIAEIDIRTFDKASQLDNQRPANIEEAEYSIPYVLGAAIIEGEFGPDQLQSEKLSDNQILKQAKKIKLSEEPRFSEQYPKKVICEVSIKTKEGKILSAINQKIDGDWDVTLSDDQLKNKFARFSTKRLTGDQINRIVDQILSIESVTSIKKFIEMLNVAVI